MKAPKQPCQTVLAWLKANLGPRCTAPLTGTDAKALMAAVQIIELYAYCGDQVAIEAFGNVVVLMQPCSRELAYHAIAHVMDWSDRLRIWKKAGLPELAPRRCLYEPAMIEVKGCPE